MGDANGGGISLAVLFWLRDYWEIVFTMPNLTFVLPHWLYWSGLVLFPLLAMFIIKRNVGKQLDRISLPLAYFLLITGGFIGLHRFYLRSLLGFVFVPLFLAILLVNVQIRSAQNAVSMANNEQVSAKYLLKRSARRLLDGFEGAKQIVVKAKQQLAASKRQIADAKLRYSQWEFRVRLLAVVILILMLIDALLLPRLKRRCEEIESKEGHFEPQLVCPIDLHGAEKDPTLGIHFRITDVIDKLNGFAGNFVAYWSAIAVFVYYYEVIARYVFNSPTNWAHESMFLMFGMQYLLAGGYVLREGAHVRVDVIYMQFSARGKAFIDVITSVFFFIFTGTLLWTGWIFFMDSFEVFEVSFTEWAIQYWTVKFALPLGGALILLQGLSRLSKDILLLLKREHHGG